MTILNNGHKKAIIYVYSWIVFNDHQNITANKIWQAKINGLVYSH